MSTPGPNGMAYAVTLPNGLVVRRIWRTPRLFVAASRVRGLWRVETWSASRRLAVRFAGIHLQRLHRAAVGATLMPEEYEVQVLPTVISEPPPALLVYARMPTGARAQHYYRPDWGEPRPICAVAVCTPGDGWSTTAWPATPEERESQLQRALRTHGRAEVVPLLEPRRVAGRT